MGRTKVRYRFVDSSADGPRFVYGAASAFLDRYAGYRYETTLKESDNLHAYLFGKGVKKMVSFFAIGQTASMRFESDAGSITMIDAMGNESSVKKSRSITVTAGNYPKMLVFRDASFVKIVE